MATGDYVIRRNASNTDVIPATGSDLLLDWPTAVANVGSGITHSSGTFSLGETGHFLVMCSDHAQSADNTNNERINYKMTLTLNAVELVEGYSTAYMRKGQEGTSLRDYFPFSAAVINVTSTTGTGDELEVRCERIDDVIITGPVRVVDDRSGITIIKLDDSWDYGRYQSSSVTATSATDNVRTVMNIQTQDEQDASFIRSTNTVEIDAVDDLVLAVYSVKCEAATGRSEFQPNLFLNGSALDGSWNQVYIRTTQAADWGGSSNVVLLNPTAGWNLDVGIVSREGGGESFDVALQLIRLPAGTEACIAEATTGNYNPSTATNFAWDTNPYIDTAAFTHSTGNSNIDVDNAGDYIVTAAMGDSTDAGTLAVRAMPALQFRVNTTDIEHVGSTTYHRANGTADHSSLACATLLTGLSADDSIHCRNDKLGDDATTINNSAGQFAVIRLSSLFGPITHTADGAPSIILPTSAGVARNERSATGAPSILLPTAAGTAEVINTATGAPTLFLPTAAGVASKVFPATGAPSVFLPTAAGAAEVINTATGAPSVFLPTAAGVAKLGFAATGAPSVFLPTAAGASEVIKTATGAPSVFLPTAAGASEVIKTATGAPSILLPTAAGTADVTAAANTANGAPSIFLPTAAGVSSVERSATGAPSIILPTAAGVAEVANTATGAPSIILPTAAGTAHSCSQILAPDAIVAIVALSGDVTDIDEPVNSPDGNWLLLAA